MNIELLKKLEEYPLFSIGDLSKILVDKSPEYLKVLVKRLKKRGLVYRIERGKYTVHEDPMIFATKIVHPSYISLWTALRFYDMTEQFPKDVFVCVPKWKEEIKVFNTRIIFVQTKHMWGYEKTSYRGFEIFVADKEKAVIDSLLSKKVPFQEIIKSIEYVESKKLKEYAKRTESKSLIKRIGFLLDKSGVRCEDLKKKIDYNYIPLDPLMKRGGEKNRKWKIIVNREVKV